MARTPELVQPSVLVWDNAHVVIRVDKVGRNVGILIETETERRYFQCESRVGGVVLIEVAA